MKWQTAELCRITKRIRNGLNIKQSTNAGGLPITRIETISNQIIDAEYVGFAGIQEGQSIDWYLRPGEILFSHINSEDRIGNCAIYRGVPYPLIHGMNLLSIFPDEKCITPAFLLYLIRSTQFRLSLKPIIKRAVNQASVSIGNLKCIRIPLPPLSEQQRIVEILDQADMLRKKRAEADAKAACIVPALFYKMFGDPASNPKGWKYFKLQDLCTKVTDGTHDTPKPTEEGFCLITNRHFMKGYIDFSEAYKISPEDHAAVIARSKPQYGDVLYSQIGTLGTACLVDTHEEFSIKNCALFKPDPNKLTGEFLVALLNIPSFKNIVLRNASGGLQKYLSLDILRNLQIPSPPKKLQDEFSAQYTSALGILRKGWKLRESIDQLFSNLFHRAFSGDLTAKWREAHMKELLGEMQEQAKYLKSCH